jgi:HSP20 family protein
VSVVRWDPFREMRELQRSINQLFDDRSGGEPPAVGFPVDVYETPEEVVVRADLPGIREEDIQVQHHDGVLYIRAQRAVEAPEGAVWLVHQTPSGGLFRAFSLAVPVDVDSVHATYEDGVLELRLPKAPEARPKSIPVRVGAPRSQRRRSALPEESRKAESGSA